jgi:hypothetical protein
MAHLNTQKYSILGLACEKKGLKQSPWFWGRSIASSRFTLTQKLNRGCLGGRHAGQSRPPKHPKKAFEKQGDAIALVFVDRSSSG